MPDRKRTVPSPQGESLASELIRWRILTEAVQDHLGELSFASAQTARLERLVVEILGSVAEQKALTLRLRAVVRQRRGKVRQARELRSRLAAAVTGRYGRRSEKLREFGLRPGGRPRSEPRKEVAPTSPLS